MLVDAARLSQPKTNPALRNPDSFYQLGREIAQASGITIDLRNGFVSYHGLSYQDLFNPQQDIELRDIFIHCSGFYPRKPPGVSAATTGFTMGSGQCAIVGARKSD